MKRMLSSAPLSDVHIPSDFKICSTPSTRAIKVHGEIDLSIKKIAAEENSSLAKLYYHDPLKVLFPRPQRMDPFTAALVVTGGGAFGGDKYDLSISLEENAEALITAQAAEKVYRSSGPDCEIDVVLNVAPKGRLEWLPQETILFDQAKFRRKTTLNLDNSSQALVGEILVFGRLASGEEMQQGLVREAWDVSIDNQLVWKDALHLEGDLQRNLNHPSAFGGGRAMATAVYYDQDMTGVLDFAREFMPEHASVRAGVTLVNGLLICRWLAEDPYDLRKSFGSFWAAFRHKTMGRAAKMPRLWTC